MPMREISALLLSTPHLSKVQAILRRYVPHAEVWAYGSRVTGDGHEASDLDLVVRHPLHLEMECSGLPDLKEAFVESDLPIRVEVLDWARIPADFQREVEKQYVVLQTHNREETHSEPRQFPRHTLPK